MMKSTQHFKQISHLILCKQTTTTIMKQMPLLNSYFQKTGKNCHCDNVIVVVMHTF